MKKIILLSLALFLSVGAFSQGSGIGIGVMLGDPTGFSAKWWTSEKTAIDLGVGASFFSSYYGYATFRIHGDFLLHNWSFDVAEDKLLVFFGGGLSTGISRYNFHLGIRAPGGVAWHFHSIPLEAFAEIVPGIEITPDFRFDFQSAIGARWYF
jgi:hypothetical protein